MNEIKVMVALGYAYGLLEGISMRDDVPLEVREVCAKAYKKYEETFKTD